MPQVTLSTLQTAVSERLSGNTTLYTTAETTNAINEVYRIINLTAGINQATAAVSGNSVIGQLIYAVPSPVIVPLLATFDGRFIDRLSLGALARNFPGFAADTTAKSGPVQHWAPMGIGQFVLHPADSVGGRVINITGVSEPTLLAAGGDKISVEDEYFDAIVSGAAQRLQLKVGGKLFADSIGYLTQFRQFLQNRSIYQGLKFPRFQLVKGAFR